MATNSSRNRLPGTLCELWGNPLCDETWGELNKATREPRARIIYGLNDAGAPVPHVGVLLLGRCIGGWIIELGIDDDSAFEAVRFDDKHEAVSRNLSQSLIAHPMCGNESLVRNFGAQLHQLQLLNTRLGVVTRASGGKPNERVVTTWKSSTTSNLIHAVGVLEICRLRQDTFGKYPKVQNLGLLVPSESSWDWECVSLQSALWRARCEMKTPAFWNLAQRKTSIRLALDPDRPSPADPVANLTSIWDGLLSTADRGLDSAFVTGLLEIEANGRRNGCEVHLVLKRSYNDKRWFMTLKIDGKTSAVRQYNIVAGRKAIKLAELTMLSLRPADSHDGMDDEAESLAAFDQLLDMVHQRHRKLAFVCEAYELTPPPH